MSAPVEPQPGPDFAKARNQVDAAVQFLTGRLRYSADPLHYDFDVIANLRAVAATLLTAESALLRAAETERMARVEALVLFNAMDHGSAEPLPEVSGIITQISNMVAGLHAALARAKQDAQQLRAGLRRIVQEEWDDMAPDDGLHLRNARDFARGLLADAARAGASPPTEEQK